MAKTTKKLDKKPTNTKTTKSTKTKTNPATTKLTKWGKFWRAALCIIAPLGGGLIISLLTRDTMSKFGMFNQPPLAPPAWLFPVAWTILYILMGVASYLVCLKFYQGTKSEKSRARTILILYAIQLVLNFIWTPIFFNAGLYWVAFAVLVAMWIFEIVIIVMTFKLSRAAFWCLLPYLLWTTFAAYLNISIAILN